MLGLLVEQVGVALLLELRDTLLPLLCLLLAGLQDLAEGGGYVLVGALLLGQCVDLLCPPLHVIFSGDSVENVLTLALDELHHLYVVAGRVHHIIDDLLDGHQGRGGGSSGDGSATVVLLR